MSMFEAYTNWVRENAGAVGAIESALSLLTWIAPGGSDPDSFTAEAVRSGVGLVSVLHESILNKVDSSSPSGSTISFWLAAINQLEVLVEVGGLALEKRAIGCKYDALVVLEALK